MHWIKDTQKAVNFIEEHLLEHISVDDVSKYIYSSTDYFQRIFNIVTGISLSEYMKNRKLSLAGVELKNTQAKIIDLSAKYGYDSPESFTRAFTRFHGVTPTSARSENLKYFHPLSIKIYIKGGFGMNRKIIPNIPEVGYYGNEVDYAFNLLAAAFSGEETKIDRAELAVYSGVANRFCWTEKWLDGRGCETLGSIDAHPYETRVQPGASFRNHRA